eukprot:4387692-Amphidinium_carterae.2
MDTKLVNKTKNVVWRTEDVLFQEDRRLNTKANHSTRRQSTYFEQLHISTYNFMTTIGPSLVWRCGMGGTALSDVPKRPPVSTTKSFGTVESRDSSCAEKGSTSIGPFSSGDKQAFS